MRVTVSGATGMIGTRLVRALQERGDEVTVLSRRPERAQESLGVEAVGWRPEAEPAPADALTGRDGVIHLAAALVSASGVDYYGARGDEPVAESEPPGDGFLAEVCVAWEREAVAAEELGVRVVRLRTAMALDRNGGALAKMLPFFRLGIGGPVAGGRQYMPWIHADDLVRMYIAALDDPDWTGPVNAVAPDPPTNREFSRALGRALHRPAVAPIPAFAIRVLYGDMAEIVVRGRRAVPDRARALGFTYAHPDLDEALESVT
jgi:uncharacterized protein